MANSFDENIDPPIKRLLKLRIAPLLVSLLLGGALSLVTSGFKGVLSKDVRLVFFLPFIVYMADAVGTQTQTIYIRGLKTGKMQFGHYIVKETLLGLVIGAFASLVVASITLIWFGSLSLTMAVSLAMFATVSIAPAIALVVVEILELEHTDPAFGAGPIATIIQDTFSVLVYGLIISIIIIK